MRNTFYDWNDDGHPLEQMKKCPTCGSDGYLLDNEIEYPIVDMNGAYVDMFYQEADTFWCACPECDTQTGYGETPDEAIRNWNRRPGDKVSTTTEWRKRRKKKTKSSMDDSLGVYVKGLEMPECCAKCCFVCCDAFGNMACDRTGKQINRKDGKIKRLDDCPLSELLVEIKTEKEDVVF